MPVNFGWQADLAALLNGQPATLSQITTTFFHYVQQFIKSEKGHQGLFPLSSGVADIREFPRILAEVAHMAQEIEGYDQFGKIEVRKWHANLKLENAPVITWKIIKRRGASFQQGAPRRKNAAKAVEERNYHFRSAIDDPNSPGMAILTYGKAYDNWVELCVWTGDADHSEDVVQWLESTMETYRWYFHFFGIQRVLFDERNEDQYMNVGGNQIYGCPLIYFVRTEKTTQWKTALLRKVAIKATVKPSN